MNTKEKGAPILPLKFDGKGINGPDEFATRLATFTSGNAADDYGSFIVRAVNHHEALVAALNAMLHGVRVPTSQADHNAEREEACSMARAVLSSLESEAR